VEETATREVIEEHGILLYSGVLVDGEGVLVYHHKAVKIGGCAYSQQSMDPLRSS
jgi:8-oxo-dGTP pyrophosphatase MutT (NUDIX family)